MFQTPAFCGATSRLAKFEHFLVYRGVDVVAAAQVRLIRTPLVGDRIAYVLWGPLFKHKQNGGDLRTLRCALTLLRQEYVLNRRLSLRVNPPPSIAEGPVYRTIFREEAYRYALSARRTRTILVDLTRPLSELRGGMEQKWRNCLNRAEKNGLEILEGNDEGIFGLFLQMYRQMLARKHIAEPGNIRAFMHAQGFLPPKHKLNVIVALQNGEPSAGAICSAIGATGVYLFGATADAGLKNKAAYLVQWRVINWLKGRNCTDYDLHGVNPLANPGVYAFKVGLSGRNGTEVELPGSFDACPGPVARLTMRLADLVTAYRARLRGIYGKYRGFTG